MELVVLPDHEAMSARGAALLAEALAEEPALAATVATGNTPMGLYARLAAMQARGEAEARGMLCFLLDDYLGVPADDPRSLWGWLLRGFAEPLGLPPDRVRRLDGTAPDPDAECARFEAELARAGGLGLALLGLGPNGHLGFNEPPCGPDAPTRVVALAPETVESNAAYWGGPERVPRRGLTLGLAPLLAARRVLLVVSGASKHAVLRRAVEGPAGPDVPASWLGGHPRCTVLADRAAWDGA